MRLTQINYTVHNTIRKYLLRLILLLLVSVCVFRAFGIDYLFFRYPLVILVITFFLHTSIFKHFLKIGVLKIDDKELVDIKGVDEIVYSLNDSCSLLFYYGGYDGQAFLWEIFLRGVGFREGAQNFIRLDYKKESLEFQFLLKDKAEYLQIKDLLTFYKKDGVKITFINDFFGINKAFSQIRMR